MGETMDSRKWRSAADSPQQMQDVLFVTKSGKIYKGFLNLRDTWIIQNNDGLISRYITDSNYVVAWMELPDSDGAGWKNKEDGLPETGSYVLSKDWLSGKVHIVYVADTDRWIIRNHPDDHITFWQTSSKDMWMPLPELPYGFMRAV